MRAPSRIFRRQTRDRIRGQTQGQKPEGPQAPRVFWQRVWPKLQQKVCLTKIRRGAFNQFPREQIKNSQDIPREQIHLTTLLAFQQIVPLILNCVIMGIEYITGPGLPSSCSIIVFRLLLLQSLIQHLFFSSYIR